MKEIGYDGFLLHQLEEGIMKDTPKLDQAMAIPNLLTPLDDLVEVEEPIEDPGSSSDSSFWLIVWL